MKRAKLPMAKASRKTDGVARDGVSFERAILMDQSLWRARHCPGAELLLQQLMIHEGRYYDALTLAMPSGEVRVVYFDLTEMFKSLKMMRSRRRNG